ncbi:MAG: amino acid ABC transporter substrate-binding protein [Eggerthellaceae bacterium]|jgi:polar amino acid transport system substrate-binding protein
MKKRFVIVMALASAMVLALVALAGCGGSQTEESSTGAVATNKLIVGFDQEYPPYGYVGDDGEYTGFDLDLAKEVAQRNGWEIELQAIDWDAKDALLESGSINCIWNGFTQEGREGQYAFSEPYMLNSQVIVVKADSDIKSFDDLADKIVVTQKGSAALENLQTENADGGNKDLADTFKELQTIADYNNAFMQLDSGVVDAVACDYSIAQYQMSANEGKYVQLETPLSEEHYAVGFKTDDTATAQKVTDTLRDMYNDGTVEEICKKYEDQGLSFDNWILK